ncbi:MAG: DUF1566 domain-containing protein [Proteobacteria bacterium]|nr:DUF1566 domain-containing protein [Pseudomonadota bacterium]
MTKKLKVGDQREDGTIYAGISPDTHERMYVLPADAPLTLEFREAREYAAKAVDAQDHGGFRLPSKAELSVLQRNRHRGALKGTFNEAGGGYWSSKSRCDLYAYMQNFSDGDQDIKHKFDAMHVRCVRSERKL